MESSTGQVINLGSLYHRFAELKDKRKAKGKRYALAMILLGIFLALISKSGFRFVPSARRFFAAHPNHALALLLSSTTVPTATPARTLEAGDITRKLTTNNVERSYLLYILPGLEASQPVPALFVFHGADQKPEDIRASTGFNDIADHAGFLVVYPNGMEHT